MMVHACMVMMIDGKARDGTNANLADGNCERNDRVLCGGNDDDVSSICWSHRLFFEGVGQYKCVSQLYMHICTFKSLLRWGRRTIQLHCYCYRYWQYLCVENICSGICICMCECSCVYRGLCVYVCWSVHLHLYMHLRVYVYIYPLQAGVNESVLRVLVNIDACRTTCYSSHSCMRMHTYTRSQCMSSKYTHKSMRTPIHT